MKNKALKIGFIASLLPHILCCGLPIALSVVGLVAPTQARWHIIPHEYEPLLFLFSGIMLGISWYLILRKRNHKQECECCDTPSSHRIQKIILSCITLVFICSIIINFLTHHQH